MKSIETIINDTLTLLESVEKIPKMGDEKLLACQETCRQMPGTIREGRLKIAVVGVIKSGKSTFVNAVVGKELVKRGAGVITAITTRISKGKKNQAKLYFKSWDTINSQLQNALALFPDDEAGKKIPTDFDIRRKNDRAFLKKAVHLLIHEFPDLKTRARPEILMMQHALEGFDACKDLVQADEAMLCFSSRQFLRHKIFTADPNLAFYIKDVHLDVFGKTMDPHIEIADCQGADSTDPAQLSQVLTYLSSANLIVYCISSRIGLRQSDIAFLKQIKRLGLLDNILFVNNCDLTEHENLEDLVKIETSIRENLEFLEIEPHLFSFSCLYNLFSACESRLTQKDSGRLHVWQKEKKMIQYCDFKTNEFNLFFKKMMNKNRHVLLISNHLKRLKIILGQLSQQADIFLDLLSSDKKKEQAAIVALETLHGNASRLRVIVENSIQGAVSGLEDEINTNLRAVFEKDDRAILKKARAFIQTIDLDVEKYKSVTQESGFNQILYLMFQEFKQKFDLHVIKAVTPELKQIVQHQENRIVTYFQSLFDSYQVDLLKQDQVSDLTTQSDLADGQGDCIELEKIKKILGLELPDALFRAGYTRKVKTSVITHFGFQTLSQILISFLDKKNRFSFSPALKKAAGKIKKENQRMMKDQFEHAHVILKNNYFAPLIKAATRDFKEKINERFNRYQFFRQDMEAVLSLKQIEKETQTKNVYRIKKQVQRLSQDIDAVSDNALS